ncbi:MAG: MFS transporter [Candidatus Omnitrophota bacterium]
MEAAFFNQPDLTKGARSRLFWIYVLSSCVYFTQGIEGLPSQALFYYFKESLGFSPEKIMVLSSITMAAWLVKPLIGYCIDNFFSKKVWIFTALALDLLLICVIGLLQLPLVLLMLILILNSTNAAFRDVAVDGIMCVEGKANQATGKIQSVQWISISLSGLITGIVGGYIAEKWDYKIAFLSLAPVYLITAAAAHLYKDAALPRAASARSALTSDLKKLFADKNLIIVALFIFLYRYSPSFGTPLFFIQRDTFKWGKVLIGALGTIGTAFGIIGALLYYKFSPKIKLKKWLYLSVFLGAATSLSYLYYTPLTAIIYDVVYSCLGMFIFIMLMDFMARSTIHGLEATSFALLCSVSNLALITSNLSGAFLLPRLGLKWLIIISAATSFLCLFLIGRLKENA